MGPVERTVCERSFGRGGGHETDTCTGAGKQCSALSTTEKTAVHFLPQRGGIDMLAATERGAVQCTFYHREEA